MKEYREHAQARNPRTGPSVANPSLAEARSTWSASLSSLAYASLAEQYGLGDMMFHTPANADDQSVEQEYQSYVGEPICPMATDPIKYWEVCSVTWEQGHHPNTN
jgi:hypothetical protein